MSVEMCKLMAPALERPRDGAEQEVKPVSTTQACGRDGAAVETSSLSNILPDQKIRELEDIFTVLEEDRRHIQSLLLQQQEEHEMLREREEALQCALITLATGRVKLMSDLRSHMEKQSLALRLRPALVPAVKVEQPRSWCCKKASPDAAVQRTNQPGEADGKVNPPVVNQERQSRTWWCFKKHLATAVAVQNVSTSSAAKDADLQKIAKLEEQIRKAEFKKQQKAAEKAAKAEKKAKKAEEKKVKKEAKKAEKEGKKAAKKAEKEAKKVAKKAEKEGKKAKENSL